MNGEELKYMRKV